MMEIDPDSLTIVVVARRVENVWVLTTESPAPPWAVLGMLQQAVKDLEYEVAPELAYVGSDDDDDD